jgi:hypothetical protein
MKLYEILLPVTNGYARHMEFREYVSQVVGGYTQCPTVDGSWLNPFSKKYELDKLVPYRVATTATMWRLIVRKAFELFPEEDAIMHSELGNATIENRRNAA